MMRERDVLQDLRGRVDVLIDRRRRGRRCCRARSGRSASARSSRRPSSGRAAPRPCPLPCRNRRGRADRSHADLDVDVQLVGARADLAQVASARSSGLPRNRISLKCTIFTFHFAAKSSCSNGVQFCAPRLNMSRPKPDVRTRLRGWRRRCPGRGVGTERDGGGADGFQKRAAIWRDGSVFQHREAPVR